jgi:hypothetical protein
MKMAWDRLDTPGHETAEQIRTEDGWRLRGGVEVTHDGTTPCRLDYNVLCDSDWLTQTATVAGNVGEKTIDIELVRNAAGEWAVNGSKVWEVTGCDDIDFQFSPSTNMLPIRRLELEVGQEAHVRAAWVKFPSFALEPLEQTYTRTGEFTYRYTSAGGKFIRDISVDEAGFVLDYPGIWKASGLR